jgi:hypothetical protein
MKGRMMLLCSACWLAGWLAFPGNDHWHEDRELPGPIDVGAKVELFN